MEGFAGGHKDGVICEEEEEEDDDEDDDDEAQQKVAVLPPSGKSMPSSRSIPSLSISTSLAFFHPLLLSFILPFASSLLSQSSNGCNCTPHLPLPHVNITHYAHVLHITHHRIAVARQQDKSERKGKIRDDAEDDEIDA